MGLNRTLLTFTLGIASAFIIGALVLRLQGYQVARSFGALLEYSVLNRRALFNTLARATPLLLTGMSASIAFGSGAINLGQPGQLIWGAMIATLCGLWIDAPSIIMLPLLLIAGMAGGALWASIAVFLRRRYEMDEFITTLMLNFIADYCTFYLVAVVVFDPTLYSTATPSINVGGVLGRINHFPTEFVVAGVVCSALYIWIRYTRIGYELRLLGQNSIFTRTGGCDNNRNFSRAMVVSGALAGLAGALLIMGGQQHRFVRGIGANYGWDGVMIAIVAATGLGATTFYALFFGVLQTGSLGMEIETAVPSEFVLVFQAGVVLLVVAARESSQVLLDKIMVILRSRNAGRAREPSAKKRVIQPPPLG